MTAPIPQFKYWIAVPLLVAAVTGLWLAADGRHHWDEPAYLYLGEYQSVEQVIAGRVQATGIPNFTHGRILHALFVKGVMSATDSGRTGYEAMVAFNLALVVVSILLVFRILRDLLPDVPTWRAAACLIAVSPIILYLTFKILADNEALFAALVATYAMLAFARGGGIYLGVIGAVGLSIAALSKNQMVILPVTFWIAICAVPIAGIDRQRLAIIGVVCGVAGFLLTYAVLEWLGIGLPAYLSSYLGLGDGDVPAVAKVVNIATEFGILWLLLPFAFLSKRRRELFAFSLWLVFAMFPFVFLINSIEGRHVAVNLVAVAGLFALALEVLRDQFDALKRMFRVTQCAVGVAAVLIIMASNSLTLAIMPHRVELGQLRTMLDTLESRYGTGRFMLLTSAGYTDFHMIRVLWPEVNVSDASSAAIFAAEQERGRDAALDSYLGSRFYDSVAKLRRVETPLVYMGYRQTFAAENLHDIIAYISPALADKLLGKVELIDRLYSQDTEWLWNSSEVHLEPIARVGHYLAFNVKISPLAP